MTANPQTKPVDLGCESDDGDDDGDDDVVYRSDSGAASSCGGGAETAVGGPSVPTVRAACPVAAAVRRESFLYRSDSDFDMSPKSLSRASSLNANETSV